MPTWKLKDELSKWSHLAHKQYHPDTNYYGPSRFPSSNNQPPAAASRFDSRGRCCGSSRYCRSNGSHRRWRRNSSVSDRSRGHKPVRSGRERQLLRSIRLCRIPARYHRIIQHITGWEIGLLNVQPEKIPTW